jgi:hypothetical protein
LDRAHVEWLRPCRGLSDPYLAHTPPPPLLLTNLRLFKARSQADTAASNPRLTRMRLTNAKSLATPRSKSMQPHRPLAVSHASTSRVPARSRPCHPPCRRLAALCRRLAALTFSGCGPAGRQRLAGEDVLAATAGLGWSLSGGSGRQLPCRHCGRPGAVRRRRGRRCWARPRAAGTGSHVAVPYHNNERCWGGSERVPHGRAQGHHSMQGREADMALRACCGWARSGGGADARA